ncbi:short-chain dehydrogenase [Bimuria novae-zelandiae CBS 107.79]|uniref:Short-chain dehydrogenase n=1 Tax=Bimuria novae-zelandiae CBS 107.79 TaxID=1447943 RepID=A0A6A5VB94_9PLEO|nr:short-chain dehydrogenase [Bimuria novae-zelandiae CBS 107.79]
MSALDPSPHTRPIALQEQDLKGKVALVTGATKGIGRAICIELATRGASILGTYSSDKSAQLFGTFTQTIRSLYSANALHGATAPTLLGVKSDISRPDTSREIGRILRALVIDFDGKVDIVVFNAAVMTLTKMGEGSLRADVVDLALAGNVKFPVMLVERFLRENVFRRGGRVVAISSEGVRAERPDGGAVYAATKAALECLMRKWADELGNCPGMEGTTFNSVSVGFTKTEAYNRIPPDMRDKLTKSDAAEVTVGNRIGEVEDIAGVVGLLVSEKAGWISGSVVDVSGGKAKIM